MAEFKVGEMVFVRVDDLFEGDKLVIATIEKITPTGRIKTNKYPNTNFDSDGREITKSYHGARLEHITEKNKLEYRRRGNLIFLRNTKWDIFSDEDLDKIRDLVSDLKIKVANEIKPSSD